MGLIPGSGRSPGIAHSNPVQYSCLENPHGQRSLGGYSPWSHRESDTTVQLTHTLQTEFHYSSFKIFSCIFSPIYSATCYMSKFGWLPTLWFPHPWTQNDNDTYFIGVKLKWCYHQRVLISAWHRVRCWKTVYFYFCLLYEFNFVLLVPKYIYW